MFTVKWEGQASALTGKAVCLRGSAQFVEMENRFRVTKRPSSWQGVMDY